jgi:hypothetical protein
VRRHRILPAASNPSDGIYGIPDQDCPFSSIHFIKMGKRDARMNRTPYSKYPLVPTSSLDFPIPNETLKNQTKKLANLSPKA